MKTKPDLKQIEELLTIMERSNLKKLRLKEKDFEIELEKEGHLVAAIPQVAMPAVVSHHEKKAPASEVQVEGRFITSPMVGSFYASPSPKDPSFVTVGDEVDASTVVCIIEAMKVMNEVKAGQKGKVVEILVKNGDPVEFGTKLMRVV